MKTIKPLLTLLALSSVYIGSALAYELSPKFTVAIIKGADGSSAIKTGQYLKGIEALELTQRTSVFDKKMGLCVANLQTENYVQAKTDCSEAISAIDKEAISSHQSKRLKALAFSNRAIVNYYLDDKYAALDDLTSALLLTNDQVIVNNLHHLKKSLASASSMSTLAMTATK
ncbi:hypothetical protein [Thalassotalea ganghwensis]